MNRRTRMVPAQKFRANSVKSLLALPFLTLLSPCLYAQALKGENPFVSLDGQTDVANTLPSVSEAIDYGRLIRANRVTGPLDSGLLGESVDYYTGQVDFVATDVDLPGGNGMPVRVGRRYHVQNRVGGISLGSFGDWDLDIPHVEGIIATSVGWTVPASNSDARCSYFGAPPPAVVTTATSSGSITTSVPASEYSQGFAVVMPGEGRHELLLRDTDTPAPNGNHPVTTKELWAVSCKDRNSVPQPGGPDEGYVVTTPNGVTYTFTQGFVRPYPPLVRPADTSQAGVLATVDREEVWLLPTKVQDRYGNTVTYTYQGADLGLELKEIAANDGRRITLTYDYLGTHIQRITDGVRTWSYSYTYQTNHLIHVDQPDGSDWTIDFENLDHAQWTYDSQSCASLPLPAAGSTTTVSGTIQNPTGANGTFTFAVTRRGRYGVPSGCLTNSAGVSFAPIEPSVYDVLSLTKKQISGPHIGSSSAPLTWTLAYGGCTSSTCNSSLTTTLTNARNFKTLYTFGAQFGNNGTGNEGLLTRKQSGGNGSSYLQDEQFTYYDASGHLYPAVLGVPAQARGDISRLSSLRPVQSHSLSRDGATYIRTLSNPDAYGFSQTITRSGTSVLTEKLTFFHNTTDWVLGAVRSSHSGDVGNANDFDVTFNAHSQPTQIKRFGRIAQTLSYYADGHLNWIEDAADGATRTSFRNYSYGIPRNIDHPDGSSESVVVSSPGRIISRTDAMGHTTGYAYDSMGRLRLITPPAGYNPTAITWNPSSSGWYCTTSTGDASTTESYDAFLRSVRTTDSVGRNVSRTFDSDGDLTFESYPGSDSDGTDFQYDGLGRKTTQTDNLGHSIGITYNANSIRVQDRNGHSVTTTYMAYDEPTTNWPILIETEAGITARTGIERDYWGKPKKISRGNIDRFYTYNGYQQLYKLAEPETGTRTFTYYDNGTVKTIDHNGAATETRNYDGAGRLTAVTYSDGSPSFGFTWRADGQPDTNSHNGIIRTFAYDDASLLTSESLQIDGESYELGYAYDANAHVKTLTYPDSTSIDYAPDPFGRPTKVASFATNVTYYPNDAIHSFVYGNGITHTLTLDERLLPKKVVDANVLSSTYSYDNDGSLTQIVDTFDSARSRTLTYDSMDRLQTANGPWGSSTFEYDAQDNLKSQSGADGATLAFNATSNLPSTVTIGNSATSLTWDTRGRLQSKGQTHYAFDAADLLTESDSGPPASYFYSYDAQKQRIRTDITNSTDGSDYRILTFYDHEGRLLYQKTNLVVGQMGKLARPKFIPTPIATKFIYLGSRLLAKRDDVPNTYFIHLDSIGTPVLQTGAGGNLGSTSGEIVGTANYFPYGNTFAVSGQLGAQQVAYASQYLDVTDLLYMHERYYDPQLRRFISPDPNPVNADSGINFNRYAYASNSPYRFYDPSGREAACITVQQPCVDESGVLDTLDTIGNNLDAINTSIMAAGPVGQEVGAAEAVTVAATEEVIAQTPAALESIAEVASTVGRVFTSRDPLVGELATLIDATYPGHVVGVNVSIMSEAGNVEADILLQNAIVEVKSGGGKGLASQLLKLEAATDLPVVAYGPSLKGSVIQGAQKSGCLVITCELDLLDFIRP